MTPAGVVKLQAQVVLQGPFDRTENIQRIELDWTAVQSFFWLQLPLFQVRMVAGCLILWIFSNQSRTDQMLVVTGFWFLNVWSCLHSQNKRGSNNWLPILFLQPHLLQHITSAAFNHHLPPPQLSLTTQHNSLPVHDEDTSEGTSVCKVHVQWQWQCSVIWWCQRTLLSPCTCASSGESATVQ